MGFEWACVRIEINWIVNGRSLSPFNLPTIVYCLQLRLYSSCERCKFIYPTIYHPELIPERLVRPLKDFENDEKYSFNSSFSSQEINNLCYKWLISVHNQNLLVPYLDTFFTLISWELQWYAPRSALSSELKVVVRQFQIINMNKIAYEWF